MHTYIHNVFTWLNATVTISRLCKMTAAIIQGRLLFEGSVYQCNNDLCGYYS